MGEDKKADNPAPKKELQEYKVLKPFTGKKGLHSPSETVKRDPKEKTTKYLLTEKFIK